MCETKLEIILEYTDGTTGHDFLSWRVESGAMGI
jgi:hypothetical protein